MWFVTGMSVLRAEGCSKAVRGKLRSKTELKLGGKIKRCGFWLRTCIFKAAVFITERRIKTS